jgi:hypothetical protein
MGMVCSTDGTVEELVYIIGREVREEKRPLGRPRRTWMVNFSIDIGEIG